MLPQMNVNDNLCVVTHEYSIKKNLTISSVCIHVCLIFGNVEKKGEYL